MNTGSLSGGCWTRNDVLSAGVYRFSGMSDDGIRVFVDNLPVFDEGSFEARPYSVDKVVLGGPHVIRVEFYDRTGGATARYDMTRL